jgi:hypothetical protein
MLAWRSISDERSRPRASPIRIDSDSGRRTSSKFSLPSVSNSRWSSRPMSFRSLAVWNSESYRKSLQMLMLAPFPTITASQSAAPLTSSQESREPSPNWSLVGLEPINAISVVVARTKIHRCPSADR